MNSAALQIELQQEINKLGKLTRSGAKSEEAVRQAQKVKEAATYLANAIAAEVTQYNQGR
ncbi:hypothetical protein KMC60_gp26 [Achromobacter phage vB_AxyP_19-32_Axy11]|uniref:Uncharacterized protein n=1 Tax=Achromobacter phage vB_AxyP_19-32_Axy11 TaxID=2591042 RepID=A0A514CUB6_9CAUD|nr:hypothetical protein KMC60_gp26 [Achromobacter phage vB_AxyP_19-32_Axy11]QDH84071.1 hypothetical protein Axy11_026 [Achromobacter phage vB_AxyP_19-32_Axy11]